MSILTKAIDHLKKIRETHLSETIAYERNGQTINIPATRGSTSYETADDVGLLVRSKSTDFLVSASALLFATGIKLPEIGDKISVTEGATTLVFQVLGLGDGGHYRPSDPFGKTLRIHTKQIDLT